MKKTIITVRYFFLAKKRSTKLIKVILEFFLSDFLSKLKKIHNYYIGFKLLFFYYFISMSLAKSCTVKLGKEFLNFSRSILSVD